MTVRSDLDRLPAITQSITTHTAPALRELAHRIDNAGDGHPRSAA